jgi:UDP-N-acetylmuramyl pentapeptide phosphotransferase/UDP-N-acetylglucosamine-1-phosphate transferase
MMFKQAKTVLLTVVVFAVCARIIWWALQPILPLLIFMLLVVMLLGFLHFRKRDW